jgi:hypothetical protein
MLSPASQGQRRNSPNRSIAAPLAPKEREARTIIKSAILPTWIAAQSCANVDIRNSLRGIRHDWQYQVDCGIRVLNDSKRCSGSHLNSLVFENLGRIGEQACLELWIRPGLSHNLRPRSLLFFVLHPSLLVQLGVTRFACALTS